MKPRRPSLSIAALFVALAAPTASAKLEPPARGSARRPADPPRGEADATPRTRTEMSSKTRTGGAPPAAPGGVSPKPAAARPTAVTPARPRRVAGQAGPNQPVREATSTVTTDGPPAPAAGRGECGGAPGAAPQLQFERTRATLREFSWSDMARFFETSLDEAEPQPTQVSGPQTVTAEEAIRRSGLQRRPFEELARARAVDLLSERELARVGKALHGASPAAIRWLLRADSPALRAHVWTWLATTSAGACALDRLARAEIEAAIRDRSVAVEHGEDLVFRPLGDYALAARARLAGAEPQAFDGLLRALWADESVDPRVRALVAGLRVRRGHADSIEQGLRDPSPAVRGAVAAAAIDRDRGRYEARMLEHAAADPADLVTELVVGELLGGPDGTPQGALAATRDPRLLAALARWRGRGDPMAALPVPEHPLRFAAPRTGEPARGAPSPEPVAAAGPSPAPAPEAKPAPAREAAPARETAAPAAGPRLPGVLDEPDAFIAAP